jgi:hypothetical protein
MTDHEKNQLLDALMYHLDPDTRGKVMAEVPVAYNAYHGRQICAVVRLKDLEDLEATSAITSALRTTIERFTPNEQSS